MRKLFGPYFYFYEIQIRNIPGEILIRILVRPSFFISCSIIFLKLVSSYMGWQRNDDDVFDQQGVSTNLPPSWVELSSNRSKRAIGKYILYGCSSSSNSYYGGYINLMMILSYEYKIWAMQYISLFSLVCMYTNNSQNVCLKPNLSLNQAFN